MLRKRKRSTDSPATSRSTRHRRVVEDEKERDSTLREIAIESPKTPKAAKTPVTERRSTRKKTIVSLNQDPTMSTRSQKTILLQSPRDSEAENAVDSPKPKSRRAAGMRRATEETHSTRSRAKKEAQDSTENASDVENDGKSSLQKEYRYTRKKSILASAENVIPESSKAESVAEGLNPSTESPETVNKNISTRSKRSKVSTTVETRRNKSVPSIQSANDTVTPESSPIPVNLTPHRSFKTPKKSPLSISSPKTHSKSPLKASRTPRKLTVLVEYPDNSSVCMSAETPIQLLSRMDPSPVVISENDESRSPRTFVSYVEVQLKTSRERKLSDSSNSTTLASKDDHSANASSSRTASAQELGVRGSKLRKTPLHRPEASPQNNSVCTPPNPERLDPESPKRLRSTAKKDETSAFIPRKVNALLEPLTTTPRGRIKRSLHLTPDFTNFTGIQTSSPIPKQQETAVTLSSVFRKVEEPRNESLELLDGTNFLEASGNASSQKEKDGTYEISKSDGEAPLEKTDLRNATYELAEPVTPMLRKKAKKRSLAEVETSNCTPEAKKRCRVRFATPKEEQRARASADTPGSARKSLPTTNTPARQILGAATSRRRSRSVTKIEDKTPTARAGAKRRSNSASALSERTPRLSQRVQSSVDRLSRPRQAFNSEEKSEVKIPVPRKIPNFALIHQKKFEKMESLVDAKKRVAKRHEELQIQGPSRSLSRSPSSPLAKKLVPIASSKIQNGEFTRFGFKLRKVEAVNMMAKKAARPPAARTKDHVASNRTVLQDVRTNKRFELQMKFRKMREDKLKKKQ